MRKSLSERWAAYQVFGANRFLPGVFLAIAAGCFLAGWLMPSDGMLWFGALHVVNALWMWERLGVYRMLTRAQFDWDRVRG